MKRATLFGCVLLWTLAGCGSDPVNPGGVETCTSHEACDDDLFCNGVERCLPDSADAAPNGCVATASPCAATQACNEGQGLCETDCVVDADADGDGVVAILCGGADCDDSDPRRFPGALEVCDVDNLDEDCDPTTVGERDLDGDGVTSSVCCNGSVCGRDCNDNDRGTYPAVPELCDGVDNDCDELVDEGLRLQLYVDADHDGIGADGTLMAACPGTPGASSVGGDCDDTQAAVRPTAPEICDNIDNDCDGSIDENTVAIPWYVDSDGDGWGIASSAALSIEACVPPAGRAIRQGDCDDGDSSINPEAPERCNGIDDDCNGRADYRVAVGDTEDDDRDGVPDARCELASADTDDRDPYTSGPDSPELCDGRDNDSDGAIDEGASAVSWYADVDGDQRGDVDDSIESCVPVPGRVRDASDCDDQNAATRPGAADGCYGQANVDDDCDGEVDEAASPRAFFRDVDGDGYGSGQRIVSCQFDVGVSLRDGDCDDDNPLVNPRMLDDCAGLPGVDDDCDVRVDEEPGMRTFFVDADGDDFGAGVASSGCVVPANAVNNNDDCDDSDPFRNPLTPDDCGGVLSLDDDCDGRVDEAASPLTYYRDMDADGFGDALSTVLACEMPMGYASLSTDCDDSVMATFPNATEVCDDGADNDCDGDVDCADTDCLASCLTLEIVTPVGVSAFPHALFSEPLVARVVDGLGDPVEGRQVTLDPGTLVPEAGLVRTTGADGRVSFPLRAGLVVGVATVSLASPGATSIGSSLTVTEPPAGYTFSLVNGERQALTTSTPEYAWFAAGTDLWTAVTAAPDGTLYAGWNNRIYRISREGIVEHFAGDPSGTEVADGSDGLSANLRQTRTSPLAWDQTAGRLLFGNDRTRVFAIDPVTRVVTLVAGGGATALSTLGEVVPALDVNFGFDIRGLAVTPNALVWIVSRGGGVLASLASDGMVRPAFFANTVLSNPTSAAAVGDGSDEVYLTGQRSGFGVVLRVRQNGTTTLVAGTGGDADGVVPATSAELIGEPWIALRGGEVVVVETVAGGVFSRHRVRQFAPGGDIRTLGGIRDMAGDAGDEGPATSALYNRPGPATSWLGHVVFADQLNNAIRVIW